MANPCTNPVPGGGPATFMRQMDRARHLMGHSKSLGGGLFLSARPIDQTHPQGRYFSYEAELLRDSGGTLQPVETILLKDSRELRALVEYAFRNKTFEGFNPLSLRFSNPYSGPHVEYFKPRFVPERLMGELLNLYHLARVPLSGTGGGRYERLLWASNEFHKAHPEISSTAAYKDLDTSLSWSSFGRNPVGDSEDRKAEYYLPSILRAIALDGLFYDVMRENGMSITLKCLETPPGLESMYSAEVRDWNQNLLGPRQTVAEDQLQDVYHYALHHGTLEGWKEGSHGARNPSGGERHYITRRFDDEAEARKFIVHQAGMRLPRLGTETVNNLYAPYKSDIGYATRGGGDWVTWTFGHDHSGYYSAAHHSDEDPGLEKGDHYPGPVATKENPRSESFPHFLGQAARAAVPGRVLFANPMDEYLFVGVDEKRPSVGSAAIGETTGKVYKTGSDEQMSEFVERHNRRMREKFKATGGPEPLRYNPHTSMEELAADIGRGGSAYDPLAVAASIERRKYGQAELTRRSLAGKRKARRGRKGNPEDTAADRYADFHGYPSEEIVEFQEEEHYHSNLAQLGEMVEIVVGTVTGKQATISFAGCGVQLASNEDGNSLELVGGDQSLDLSGLGFKGAAAEKDLLVVGEVRELTYRAAKKFDADKRTGEPVVVDYFHKLGEETGETPSLLYNTMNKSLSIAGGAYSVQRVGLTN